MDTIQFLEETAAKLDTFENRTKAYGAMMGLAEIYENGTDDVPMCWEKAFYWYEQAAHIGSKLECVNPAPAYAGVCRIIKNSSFNIKVGEQFSIEEMLKQKHVYTHYIVVACDPQTVNNLRMPEIAFMVGVVCKDLGLNAELHQSREISHAEYYEIAAEYFHLGSEMTEIAGEDVRPMCAKALRELQDRGYGIGYRPFIEFKPLPLGGNNL